MVIILKNFNIKSKFKFTVLAILGLFVFLDGNYLVFFNSLYGEPMMITTLMLLIASYLHYIYKKHVMKNDKHVFINIIFVYISAWLFIGSKMQVLSALPIIMFILGKIIWNNRKIVGKKKFIVLIIAFILIVAYPIGINIRHVDIGDDTHYNSVFTGVLENASSKEQKEQALIDLGLNPKIEVNSGTNSYQAIDDYKDGFIPHTEYMDEVFYSKMSNSKLAIYYLTHFSSLMKGMEYTATMALNTSNNLGKYSYSYSKEPIGKFNRFTYWSDLKAYLPKNLLFIVGSFALIFIISVFEYIKNKKMNIWCYTGFTYETLIKLAKDNPKIIEFLKLIDVLVDGPFILEKKSLDCVFRGSTNQRIIDTKLSLKNKEVVLVDKYYTEKKVKNKRDRIYI